MDQLLRNFLVTSGRRVDPYFEYTTLLLPGNGANAQTNSSFTDASSNNFQITRNPATGPNAPTQGTFSPFSQTGWGNYFNGSSILTVANSGSSSPFTFGTSTNFTIEGWFNLSTVTGDTDYRTIISNYSASSGALIGMYLSGGVPKFRGIWSSVEILGTTTLVAGVWYNFAFCRSGTTFYLFLNGNLEGTTTGSASADSSNNWVVGKILAASQVGYFNGYISNLRVTKSVALYTSAYTPSTTPLSSTVAGGTVSLLTCQSNRFIDSTNNFTITTSGSPSVQAFSPFNPTSSWSAATNGGSGYFDGSGDYLTVASNAALQLNGEFTVEVWFYPLSLQTYDCLITTGNNSVSSNALGIFLKSNGGVQVYNQVINAVIFDTSSGVILNAWNHIAVTRNSSNGVDFWLNGVSQGATQTVSSNFASTTPTAIGNSSSLTQEFHGYIASTRIVKGIAVYTAAFTPPTAPLTATQSANTNGNPSAAITGTATSLLLNFTNAGIYDATSKNDLETVGNAQISTAQSKWGGSSMYFDGTGDYLINSSINSTLYQFGTGDFTVEFWLYPTTVSVVQYLIDFRDPASGSSAGIQWSLSASAKLGIYVGITAVITASTTSISANTWTHVALVKNGTGSGNYKFYINGNADATTGTNTTDLTQGFLTVATSSTQRNTTATDKLNGYIQDLRITKGVARTITASPTSAFPTL